MFVTDYVFLVGYHHFNHGVFVQNNALARQTRFQTRIDGTVNEVFFFLADVLQKIISFFDVYVTGAARTHTTAVVVEVNVVFFGQFQNRNICRRLLHRDGRNGFILESKMYGSHC